MPTTTTIIGAESRSSSLLPAMALSMVIILLVHLFWFSLACMHSSEILAIAGLSLVLILR
jgi:hypothetical protein